MQNSIVNAHNCSIDMHNRINWRTVDFDWNRAKAFLATAEEGSLSAAATALGATQPTVGRQVAALEAELGVSLFERTGRALALTPNGLALVEHVKAMADAAGAMSLAASGRTEAIEGTIRITASESYAVFVLPPIIAELRRSEPGIRIDLIATNAVSDLRRREADIAVRSGQPGDPSLIARKVKDDEAALYATSQLLDAIGRPQRPEDFDNAPFVGFEENEAFINGMNGLGFRLTSDNFIAWSGDHMAHWALVKEGIGVGAMLCTIGDTEPCVERATPEFDLPTFPVWLVAHRDVKTSRRVRLVYDFLADALSHRR